MEPQHQPPEGRLTFVFTDIEDSSRIKRIMGDRPYFDNVLTPHHNLIREAIAQHNGYEVKTIGDSFMLAFDAPQEAVDCVLAIQNGLKSKPITTTDTKPLRVRIGIHSCVQAPLLYKDNTGTWDYSGTDVDFAARVESLGAGGQILVSDSTHRALGSPRSAAWQAWGNRRIKSFDTPETVWEILWNDGQSQGEPGSHWLPEAFAREKNRYIPRPAVESIVLGHLAQRQSNPYIVTLHGIGGTGKTRLAIACATQAAGCFRDGVFFIELAERRQDPLSVAQAIGAALELEGEAQLPAGVLGELRHKERLLILDNYESVACREVAEFLGDLTNQCPKLWLLVTGRESTRIRDIERRLDLDKLLMSDPEAEELFVVRAQQVEGTGDWQPTVEEKRQLARVLILTEKIPLAIELAAAWASYMSIREIADGLQAALGEQTEEPPGSIRSDRTARHASLRTCLDWSYNLLENDVQRAFPRLGLFADSFTADMVSQACGLPDMRRLLNRLQDAALIRRFTVNGLSRFQFHRFTREYALSKLSSHDTDRTIRQQFVQCFARLAVQNADPYKPDQFTVMDSEWRNVFGAMELADEINDHASYMEIGAAVYDFAECRWLLAEYEPIYRRLLKVRETMLGTEHPHVATTCNNLAGLYQAQGRYVEAERLYRRALQIREAVLGTEHPDIATTYNNLAVLYRAQGRYVEAEPLYRRALQIREVVLGTEHPDVVITCNNLAVLYRAQGRYVEAEPLYRRALQIAEAVLGTEHPDIATTCNNLAGLYRAQGRYVEAEPLYRRALQIREVVLGTEHPDVVITCNNLAVLYQAQGRYVEAEPLYRQAIRLLRSKLGADHPHLAMALDNYASLLKQLHRDVEAARVEKEVLSIRTRRRQQP